MAEKPTLKTLDPTSSHNPGKFCEAEEGPCCLQSVKLNFVP